MNKCNPEPWSYKTYSERGWFLVVDANGGHILTVNYWESNKKEKEAIVRLIVAAPRMLALIKKAIDIMDDIAQDCKWLDEANALIAEIEKIK